MTALPCDDLMWTTATRVARGSRPKASLMLKLRALDDVELADLEADLAVYARTGIVCQRMIPFVES